MKNTNSYNNNFKMMISVDRGKLIASEESENFSFAEIQTHDPIVADQCIALPSGIGSHIYDIGDGWKLY